MQKWAEKDDYWKKNLPFRAEQVEKAQKSVEQVIEKLAKKGVNIADFQHQQETAERKIAALDKAIEEELPIIRERLITQYKQEKQERLNAPQIDYVQERAAENKTFFKIRPPKNEVLKEAAKTIENTAEKEMPQEQQERTYKAFKR